jgi:hypothetical protein
MKKADYLNAPALLNVTTKESDITYRKNIIIKYSSLLEFYALSLVEKFREFEASW